MIGTGPAMVSGDYESRKPAVHWSYDRYKVALQAGEVKIRAEVISQPIVMANVSMGHGGFLFELRWRGEGESRHTFGSDMSWLGGIDTCYAAPDTYNADGSIQLFPCEEVTSRWDLRPKELSHLREKNIRHASLINPLYPNRVSMQGNIIRISKGSPCTFWLEYDKTYAAYLRARIHGYRGTKVAINVQEIIGRTDRSEKITTGESLCSYRGLMLQSVHYLNIVVSNMQSDVDLDLSIDASCYDGRDQGSFTCSDSLLNDIYRLGVWTTRICRQHYHLDSPPSGDAGDYMIQNLIASYAFGDYTLARADIKRISDYLQNNDFQLFHPSFTLLWILLVYDHMLFSGDFSGHGPRQSF